MEEILKIARRFNLPEGGIEAKAYGNGHINDTYRVTAGAKRYVLQRINGYVFKRPEEVIENIVRVTDYLRGVIAREGGDPARGTIRLLQADGGPCFARDDGGGIWRMYAFIEGTKTVDMPDTPALFELSGRAFGRFARQMGGFDAALLHETIPDFHNTPARYRQLEDAAARNAAGRLGEVAAELEFCKARERETHALVDALAAGEIPLRVTHNDTKLNNVLIDEATGEGVCVIDLDTVMPGLAAYDFGDAIRSGANTAAEDETDLSKVDLSLDMFEAFARGYLSEAGRVMGRREIGLLPMGAKLMTLECGMRFLADHLDGDVYFKTHRQNHNLDRARCQFRLVERMEEKWDAMMAAVEKYC